MQNIYILFISDKFIKNTIMENKLSAFIVGIVMTFTSCSTLTFYQVYQANPSSKNVQMSNNSLVYEDDNCIVSYNLWSKGGNIGFNFYNKTDNIIFLNLNECFFVMNGIAHDYYKNRNFTNSVSSGSTGLTSLNLTASVSGLNNVDLLQTNSYQTSKGVGLMSTKGQSVTYIEKMVISIPAKTSKIISEFDIVEYIYRDCILLRFPFKSQIKTVSFDKSESPFVFSNRITYSVAESKNTIRFENEFYISQITNYPESEMFVTRFEEFCGQKTMDAIKVAKKGLPNEFYNTYTKGQYFWKH